MQLPKAHLTSFVSLITNVCCVCWCPCLATEIDSTLGHDLSWLIFCFFASQRSFALYPREDKVLPEPLPRG